MAYSASLIIESTSNNEKKQKSITDINPNASNSDLEVLARGINALTTNIYIGGTKVLKQNISESDSGKITPTLSLTREDNGVVAINYNGNGHIYAETNNSNFYVNVDENVINIINYDGELPTITGYTVTVYATETDTYSAKTAQITM